MLQEETMGRSFGRIWKQEAHEEEDQCIFTLLLLPPLGEGQSPLFEQTWNHSTQGRFVPSLVKIGPVVLEIFK
jgi:hypothetical protein